MAAKISPCSSSSTTFSLNKEPFSSAKFLNFSRKSFPSKWAFKIHQRINPKNLFELKSPNGHPLNVVSLQDDVVSNNAKNQARLPSFNLLRRLFLISCYHFLLAFQVDAAEKPLAKENALAEQSESNLSVTIVGASGDLAKKKIFPALFALFYEDCLPQNFIIFGYARTKMTDEELRETISRTLTCRIDKRENCGDKMEEFLARCFYHSGQYNSEENFAELDNRLKQKENGKMSNRLFYLSIPPDIFVDVVRCASHKVSSETGWTRVIVEKPFGRDSESSAELTRSFKKYLAEDQIFRIDHYLGKELVENLSVLRFSNLVFEPLWSRNYIRNVQFIFSEDFGTEGRGG